MNALRLYVLRGYADALVSACAAASAMSFVSSVLLLFGFLNSATLLYALATCLVLALAIFLKLRRGAGATYASAAAALLSALGNALIFFVMHKVW
ncbi:MAG: hypothetical protein QXT43_00910 [Candidatus Micrarchaeaceae archaeon]